MTQTRFYIYLIVFITLVYPFVTRNEPDSLFNQWLFPSEESSFVAKHWERVALAAMIEARKSRSESEYFDWLLTQSLRYSIYERRVYQFHLRTYVKRHRNIVYPWLIKKLDDNDGYVRYAAYNELLYDQQFLPQLLDILEERLSDFTLVKYQWFNQQGKFQVMEYPFAFVGYATLRYLLVKELGYPEAEISEEFPEKSLSFSSDRTKSQDVTYGFSVVKKMKTWLKENKELLKTRAANLDQ